MPEFILASTSPQRKALLKRLIPAFRIVPPNLEKEALNPSLEFSDAVADLAARKVSSISWQHAPALCLGADTIIVMSDRVFGKPHSEEEAKTMLRTFSGRSHRVITGVALKHLGDGRLVSFAVETDVYFKTLSEATIQAYVGTGEWENRAGAYAIQSKGVVLTDKIIGSYTNVVGLPLEMLSDRLREFGVDIYGAGDAQYH